MAAAEEARAALEEVNTHLRERLLETELARYLGRRARTHSDELRSTTTKHV